MFPSWMIILDLDALRAFSRSLTFSQGCQGFQLRHTEVVKPHEKRMHPGCKKNNEKLAMTTTPTTTMITTPTPMPTSTKLNQPAETVPGKNFAAGAPRCSGSPS